MGGKKYNPSLSVMRAAREKATTRTPSHFYTDVPMYVVELPCQSTFDNQPHTFRSRTLPWELPAFVGHFVPLWCDRCKVNRWVSPLVQPLNWPDKHPTDQIVAAAQDKGILRERCAMWMARHAWRAWDEAGEADLYEEAIRRFGVTMTEARRLFNGIVRPQGVGPAPDMCRAGKHEMTDDNTLIQATGRRCRACYNEGRAARRKKAKR